MYVRTYVYINNNICGGRYMYNGKSLCVHNMYMFSFNMHYVSLSREYELPLHITLVVVVVTTGLKTKTSEIGIQRKNHHDCLNKPTFFFFAV